MARLKLLYIISVLLMVFIYGCGNHPLKGEEAGNSDPAKKLLREGFHAFNRGQVIVAEEKWSQGLGILKQKEGTDKEQGDNLIQMGKYLQRIGKQREALSKFAHALSLYRGIADVEGQKISIAYIEEISPMAVDILGKHIYTIPLSSEERVKIDKDGYMIGREATQEEDALFTEAMIDDLEKKQYRTEEEEKALRSLREKKSLLK